MTEPPITFTFPGHFHRGTAPLPGGISLSTYRKPARRVAFAALIGDRLTAQLVVNWEGAGGWLIADAAGKVTAHRGQHEGGRWALADAIIPGSAGAVQRPSLNGHARSHPEEYRRRLDEFDAARLRLHEAHAEALSAGNLFAELRIHPNPVFLALLKGAVRDRTTQKVLHDWLAENDFPHAEELLSKKWAGGLWTEAQLLDLLSKPFSTTRRSFRGRTV